ncbi:hypothetical protein KGP36_01135 [Patescibacteria group bacterium]|nr:hypothetical protein [Patescibacteria group bacterium]
MVRIQVPQQFRRKLKIARKRRTHIAMRRAGRHSSPDPSCRPARIFLGVFGKWEHQGEGGAGGCGEGAVEDERVRTDFLEEFAQFLRLAAFRQNGGLFAVFEEIYDRFEPIRSCSLHGSHFVLQKLFFGHKLVLG